MLDTSLAVNCWLFLVLPQAVQAGLDLLAPLSVGVIVVHHVYRRSKTGEKNPNPYICIAREASMMPTLGGN